MTDQPVTEHIRFRLAQSMPVIERHRDELLRSIQNLVVGLEQADEPFGDGDVASMMLLDLLIACAGDVAAFGGTRDLGPAAREHVRLGISGRLYTRFGMSLAPALRDALGLRVSPRIISAWCDTYWLVIREMAEKEEGLVVDEYLQIIR